MDKFGYSNMLNESYVLSTSVNSLNVFMVLCYKAWESTKNNELITLEFGYLKNLLNLENQSDSKLLECIERLKKDLMKCIIKINPAAIKAMMEGNESNIAKAYFVDITLFPLIITDIENRVLKTRVCSLPDELFIDNMEYKKICEDYILSFFNDIKEYTLLDLQEYIKLKSKFSKNLYKHLKQYRTTGWREISLNDLRTCMNCRAGYTTKEFMRSCLYPAVKELEDTECFKNLKMEIKRDESKKGKPIKGYRFTFKKEMAKGGPASTVDTTPPPVEDRKQVATASKPDQRNRFNNFQQREYSTEDFTEMERLFSAE